MDGNSRSPLKIFRTYILVGSIYIVFSDFLLDTFWPANGNLNWVQTAKGLGFVLVTGLLLFAYLKRVFSEISSLQKKQSETFIGVEILPAKCRLFYLLPMVKAKET